MNRTQRRKEARQLNPSTKQIKQGLDIIHSVERMVLTGAMQIDLIDFRLSILPELFWKGKSNDWRRNFSKNMLVYLQSNAGIDPKDVNHEDYGGYIFIHAIDDGRVLGKFDFINGLTHEQD